MDDRLNKSVPVGQAIASIALVLVMLLIVHLDDFFQDLEWIRAVFVGPFGVLSGLWAILLLTAAWWLDQHWSWRDEAGRDHEHDEP